MFKIIVFSAALALGSHAHAQQGRAYPEDAAGSQNGRQDSYERDLWPAAALQGVTVMTSDGEEAGRIIQVLVDRRGRAVAKIDVSGFLGAPGQALLLPLDEIMLSSTQAEWSASARFVPTDRTGGSRIASPEDVHPDAPPSTRAATTREAINQTFDRTVPMSVGAPPVTGRREDPRGARAYSDVRRRSDTPSYFEPSRRRALVWGSPEFAFVNMSANQILRMLQERGER